MHCQFQQLGLAKCYSKPDHAAKSKVSAKENIHRHSGQYNHVNEVKIVKTMQVSRSSHQWNSRLY